MDANLATLINTKVNQAVIDATAESFKMVQPQLQAMSAQIATINGKPLVPSSNNKPIYDPMRSVRAIFGVKEESLPVVR
jgi:hypothetical protein